MRLTLNLTPEHEATLQARALAQGVSAEQYALGVLEKDLQTSASPKQTDRHISEIFAEIVAGIPTEEFDKLPRDGSLEHDHFLCGHRKRYD
jgi:hypothetical protein